MIGSAAEVISFLEDRGVPSALIGGLALGAHGLARATLDIDVLVADTSVLDPSFWTDFPRVGPPEIRRGDADDPLIGVVRFPHNRPPIDIIVGRPPWTASILARRLRIEAEGQSLRVVDLADLVTLKLFAAGPQDILDVRILLEADTGELRSTVAARLSEAPQDVARLWGEIVTVAR